MYLINLRYSVINYGREKMEKWSSIYVDGKRVLDEPRKPQKHIDGFKASFARYSIAKLNGRLRKIGAKPIPTFNFPVFIRCRCQAKGGGSYNFNMVQTMKAGRASPYNLLPMNPTGSISTREANSETNQQLLKALRM